MRAVCGKSAAPLVEPRALGSAVPRRPANRARSSPLRERKSCRCRRASAPRRGSGSRPMRPPGPSAGRAPHNRARRHSSSARRSSAGSAPGSAAAPRQARRNLPIHAHRQAGIARVEPIAVPARLGPHDDRQLDLAAGHRRSFSDQFRRDRGVARLAQQRRSGEQETAATDRASRTRCDACAARG